MAPGSTLLTAGTITLPKPLPSIRRPITTQEKLDAAAVAEARRKAQAASPPLAKPAKKSRTKYLPPPDEAFPAAQPRVKGLSAANDRRKKAVTTQEKIKQWEVGRTVMKGVEKGRRAEKRKAKKEAMGDGKVDEDGEKAAEDGKAGKDGDGVKKGSKRKEKERPYVPSTLTLMSASCEPSVVKYEDKKGNGVLFRPTARATGERAAMKSGACMTAPPVPQNILKSVANKKQQEPFSLMKSPEEIRNSIWNLAIVHHPFCVWPGQRRGREQPDLCMSGREVRAEVLPVFYGVNVFGIDITPLPKPEIKRCEIRIADGKVATKGEDGAISKAKDSSGAAGTAKSDTSRIPKPENKPKPSKRVVTGTIPDPIAEIKPWARALETGGNLGKIQHWLFSSAPEIITPPSRVPKMDDANSLVVYLRIWRETVDALEMPQTSDSNAVETGSKLTVWRASVEVHREATCVLPRQAQCQRCMVQMTAEWLNGVVDLVLRQAERKGGITAEMVVRVAEVLRERVSELVRARCETV